MKAIPGKKYLHQKGGLYTVLALAHVESDPKCELVIYRMEYSTPDYPCGTVWARPRENFEEVLTIDGNSIERFSLVSE